MSSETGDAFGVELAAQVAKIRPEIEGYRDLSRSFTEDQSDARAAADARVAWLQARLDLIATVDKAVADLNAHGYPAVPDLELPAPLFALFTGQKSTIDAAIATTKPRADVTGGTVEFAPTDTP